MKIILINDSDKIENDLNYAVCLGIFDGVHLGHRALIEKTVSIAKKNNLKAGMLTFIKKGDNNKIYPLETQIKLVEKMGIDTFFIIDFNDSFKNQSPEEFVDKYLIDYIKAKEVICGFNYRFGKGREGSPKTLKELSKKVYNLTVIPPVEFDGEIVSSTLIKKYLSEGNVKKANMLLASDFTIEGFVKEGNKIGRTINFPTVNIPVPKECMTLKAGVYAVKAVIDKKEYQGISNVGIAPTVRSSEEVILETYIVDFSSDVYNKNVKIYFKDFIREEKKFSNIDDLKETIEENLKTVKKILG